MSVATARVPTAHARKYLTQLSKHWSHRFPDLTYTAETARIPLPDGPTRLAADDQALDIRIEAVDAETRERLQGVVADHLKRFAFREELAFDWTAEAD